MLKARMLQSSTALLMVKTIDCPRSPPLWSTGKSPCYSPELTPPRLPPGGNYDDPSRVRDRRRSSEARSSRQSQPARWQRHRGDILRPSDGNEAAGPTA